jgi:diguanylate cyclase (GGDEF)-like protein
VEEKEIGLIVFTNPKVPATIQKYVKKLWKKSKIKLLYLDSIPRIFQEQLSQSLSPEVSSIWPQDLPKYQALHDSITGLPNLMLFQDRLAHSLSFAKRYETQPLIMFVHLDQIDGSDGVVKHIHLNQVLVQISKKLLSIKRESDTLAYIAEKEFAYIFENVQSETATVSISKRILNMLTKPIEVDGKKITLHFSISTSNDFNLFLEIKESEKMADTFESLIEKEIIAKI